MDAEKLGRLLTRMATAGGGSGADQTGRARIAENLRRLEPLFEHLHLPDPSSCRFHQQDDEDDDDDGLGEREQPDQREEREEEEEEEGEEEEGEDKGEDANKKEKEGKECDFNRFFYL
jgi:hypothetical protein